MNSSERDSLHQRPLEFTQHNKGIIIIISIHVEGCPTISRIASRKRGAITQIWMTIQELMKRAQVDFSSESDTKDYWKALRTIAMSIRRTNPTATSSSVWNSSGKLWQRTIPRTLWSFQFPQNREQVFDPIDWLLTNRPRDISCSIFYLYYKNR